LPSEEGSRKNFLTPREKKDGKGDGMKYRGVKRVDRGTAFDPPADVGGKAI